MDKKHIYIFGHKNPDTDSICSAISYAYLKNQIASRMKENDPGLNAFAYAQESQPDVVYSPRRAGQLNPETEYLLKRFNTPSPVYINDVRVQVGDINVRKVDGVTENISLKQAWTIMRTVNIATLPVLNKDRTLKGLITIGDIARSYMAVYDNTILGKSHTPYANILDALDGELITGDPKGIVQRGRVTIGTATTELIREHIEPGDVIILGNRYETQLCAIEGHASLLIVCEGSPISRTIRKIAEQNGSAIISTHFDTYTVARLINQSVPISYFMKKDDLVTFKTTDFIAEIKGTMLQKRHRDFPVLTPKKKFAGMISRRSLINMPAKQIILVDHNEIDQAVDGIHDAEVIEIVDHHKLGTVETMKPISGEKPAGRLALPPLFMKCLRKIILRSRKILPDYCAEPLFPIPSYTGLLPAPRRTKTRQRRWLKLPRCKPMNWLRPCLPQGAISTQNPRKRSFIRTLSALRQAQ